WQARHRIHFFNFQLLIQIINLLLLFLVVPDTQKNAKQPNTFLDKLSNQLPAIYMESIIFVN
ncbi:MAG: hypothetical protein MJY73_03160, partial [Bacteroidales bacterium]|nr:hypothetical protein [Bacteroidales bacterium]